MELSVFDIFKVGIGPSSSHTVGPMRAAGLLLVELENLGIFDRARRVQCELYGSLAATGRGHHTDRAVIWGLIGQEPETIAPDDQEPLYQSVVSSAELRLQGRRSIQFIPDRDIIFRAAEQLPYHPNGMRFTVFDATDVEIYAKQFYSIGGGFVVGDKTAENDQLIKDPVSVEHPFSSCDELLKIAHDTGKSIAEIIFANEHAWRTTAEIEGGLETIQQTMNACIERGCRTEGVLPGAMRVVRRAPALHRTLTTETNAPSATLSEPWIGSCFTPLPSTKKTPPGGGWSRRPPMAPPGSSPRVCVFSSALSAGWPPPRNATSC